MKVDNPIYLNELKHIKLSIVERDVLAFALVDHQWCPRIYPSIRQIAKDARHSKNSVVKAIKSLEAKGLITKYRKHWIGTRPGKGGRPRNSYKLNNEVIRAAIEEGKKARMSNGKGYAKPATLVVDEKVTLEFVPPTGTNLHGSSYPSRSYKPVISNSCQAA